ncbi:prophage Lp2 protein 53, partial [Lactiplantibacillus plantarum]
MAKTLEFTTKSPRQIKQGDTETTFTFICKNAGSAIDLTQATSITAKIGNDSGYLRSQSIAITSLAGLKPGWLNLQPMPTLIA